MKLTPPSQAAWQELRESFLELQRVMSNPPSLSIMVDQLSKAKAVQSDLDQLIEKLRRDKHGE